MSSMFPVFVPKTLSRDEYFVSGRRSCKGCGKALSVRMVCKMVGDRLVVPGFMGDTRSPSPCGQASAGLVWDEITAGEMTSAFIERFAADVRRPAKALVGIDRRVFAKDPLALFDMFGGQQDIVCICYDSEMYMDDLIKRSVPSLNAQKPRDLSREEAGSFIRDKTLPPAVRDYSLSYCATACPSFPLDLMEKVKKALRSSGTALINLLTPCPTGWRFKPELTVFLGSLAVSTGFYPLLEVEDGTATITRRVIKRKPLNDYFKVQQRYLAFPPEWMKLLQDAVSDEYDRLMDCSGEKGGD